MSKRDFLNCTLLAAGAFGVTLALIGPARLNADGPSDPQGVYATPAVPTVNGVQLSLRLPNSVASPRAIAIEPANSLAFELVAVNTLDRDTEIPARVALSTSDPVARMSRMGSPYLERWTSEGNITLKPRETRIVSLRAYVDLVPSSNVTLRVSSPNSTAADKPTLMINNIANRGTVLSLSVKGEPPARSLDDRNSRFGAGPSTRPAVVVANFTLDR